MGLQQHSEELRAVDGRHSCRNDMKKKYNVQNWQDMLPFIKEEEEDCLLVHVRRLLESSEHRTQPTTSGWWERGFLLHILLLRFQQYDVIVLPI